MHLATLVFCASMSHGWAQEPTAADDSKSDRFYDPQRLVVVRVVPAD